ncbi:hypothetical protein E2542_SST09561 [Spatholobus suberectus]|nr:hypothetical protein E2542_SST09561 [Spatholobus suberectus]
MQQTQASSSRSQDLEEMNQLRQRLSASEEEIRRMSCQFQSFIGAVLRYLPGPTAAVAQNIFHQQQQQQDDDQQQHEDNQQ